MSSVLTEQLPEGGIMDRVILHCDCNNFFASVETVFNPSLRNVPMAVCGDPEDRHGIVLAKNELAKEKGIKTADTVYSAKRKCPGLVICPPRYEAYYKYSKKVNAVYADYTDMIEPFGIDESWLDVTASRKLFGDGRTIADTIRKRIREEIGLTVSVGVSFNKVFAKLGSDYKKPDATTVIDRSNYREIVFPLPVGDMLYVGAKTQRELSSLGINTIGALAACDESFLCAKFGKGGSMMYRYANGLDDSPVTKPDEREDAKSVGSGLTFKHNLTDPEECRVGLLHLSEDVAARLRRSQVKCSTVQLTVKDEYLRTIQRQRRLSRESDIAREISEVAFGILCDEWPAGKPIRALTVTAFDLVRSELVSYQLDFFEQDNEEQRNKSKKREETIDKIRQKYGASSIMSASIVDTDIGIHAPKSKKN